MNDQAPLIYEDGEQTRDFVHVSDIARANLLALETDKCDYHAVNIGTGDGHSVKTIGEFISQGLGKAIAPEITGKYREGDIRHSVADISKARELLGFEPKVKLEDGLAELLDWLEGQKATDNVETAAAELAARSLVK
jgi:dTDP-L-rhamnose 4-epimerase